MADGAPPAPPLLSVVVASVESALSLKTVLAALAEVGREVALEVVVADASRDGSAEIAEAWGGAHTVLRHPPGTLVPALWADGIRHTRGRYVALSTGHCVVPRGWATALVEALADGAGGAGAGLVLRPEARAVDRAVFFLRYGGFLAQTQGSRRRVEDIPGDNAAYHGDALRDFVERHPAGFWELEYHAELAAAGSELVAVPAAAVGFGRAFPFGTILRHRFVHGRHFGATRASAGGRARLRVLLPAPLVPFVLLARNARGAFAVPGYGRAFLTALPPFLALSCTWAAGEAFGALFGPPPGHGAPA